MTPQLARLLARSQQWADHPTAKEAYEEIKGLVQSYDRRKHDPHRWHRFHAKMAASLPKWQWAARLHHRRMARRYAAHAWAMDEVAAMSCKIPGTRPA